MEGDFLPVTAMCDVTLVRSFAHSVLWCHSVRMSFFFSLRLDPKLDAFVPGDLLNLLLLFLSSLFIVSETSIDQIGFEGKRGERERERERERE